MSIWRSWTIRATKAAALCAGGALVLAALLLGLAIDRKPAFPRHDAPQPTQVGETVRHLRALWAAGSAPAGAAAPALGLPTATVQVLGVDVLQRGLGAVGAQVLVGHGVLDFGVSLPLARFLGGTASVLGGWLNLRARLEAQTQGLPRLVALRCGALPLPVPQLVQRQIFVWLSGQRPALERARLASKLVQTVSFGTETVKMTLAAPAQLLQRVREQSLMERDIQGLRHYQQVLGRALIAQLPPAGTALPLSSLLRPLWQDAVVQAQLAASQPDVSPSSAGPLQAREFRLALMLLGLYALQVDPEIIAPGAGWQALPHHGLELRGRSDHALHFVLSAWLSMGGGQAWADLVGLYKELSDAGLSEGSGFSFDDLVADRAGTELGLRAANEPLRLARSLQAMTDDSALMPVTTDLPSALSTTEFAARFGRVGSSTYLQLMEKIEQRVASLALLRVIAP
jgi:hypothetical protein